MDIKSDKVEIVSTNLLIPYSKNSNKHTDEQIDEIIKQIEYQGWRDPILAQKGTNIIAAGHGRWMAAKKMGLEKVPVIFQEFESEAQFYAFVVAHNAVTSPGWGGGLDLAQINSDIIDFGPELDVDLLGIKDFVIEPIEKFEPQSDEDDVPEVVHPITRRGDIWLLGNHRLMCGDSTMIDDVEKLMNGEKSDFGFCDPPYNLGFEYNTYDDNKTDDEYIKFSELWFSNLKLFTKRQAVTLGTKNIKVMSNLDDCVAGVACWVKKNWITSCHIAKLQQWEPIFFFGDYTKHKRSSDLFEINRKIQKDVGNDHTCPKQIELIDEILINYCDESVIDLFGGSGTTMISSEKNNKKSFLMEFDEKYCDVIINRWQNYTGKKAVLESTKQTYEELKQERGE